jgi:hypothetical protein
MTAPRTIALSLLCCLSVAPLSQEVATGGVSGTVRVNDSGAVVLLARVLLKDLSSGKQLAAVTDDRGRYDFGDVPSGRYLVVASKAGYIDSGYRQAQFAYDLSTPIVLRRGEALSGIDIGMPRGGVLTGRIQDDEGRSVPYGLVTALDRNPIDRTAAASGGTSVRTDGRGVYRLFGLRPGYYIVAAQPSPREAISAASEVRPTDEALLNWALGLLQHPGTDTARPAAHAERGFAYPSVYYPNAVEDKDAELIPLALSEEHSGVDFVLARQQTARLEGQVSFPAECPKGPVRLSLMTRAGASGATMTVVTAGAFAFQGLLPGQYTVFARTTAPVRGASGSSSSPPPPWWGRTNVLLAGQDANGDITLQPSVTLSVNLDYHGLPRLPPRPLQLTASLTPARTESRVAGVLAQTMALSGDGIQLDGIIPDWYRFRVNVPSPPADAIVVDSMRLGDTEVLDAPFEVTPQSINGVLTIGLTTPGTLTGRIVAPDGQPVSGQNVLVFSKDVRYWFRDSTRVRGPLRTASDGTFAFGDLVPGDYLVSSVPDMSRELIADSSFMAALAQAAVSFSVMTGGHKSVDLTLVK